MKQIKHTLILTPLLALSATAGMAQAGAGTDSTATAQQDSLPPITHTRSYTSAEPLVYEGTWGLWPYTFLNENGEPDGYSVDLVKLIMGKLGIPFEIKLKPTEQVFNDLKSGQADLVLGIAVGFHDAYGHYSNTSVTLFTQSVVTPKSKEIEIHNFNDLATHKVIVNDGSLCHHLMMSNGWGDNAIPSQDLKESILKVSANEEGQIVWNTLSLKWLVRRYQLDNLQITPVNMPHGEYKFMSNDLQLLASMDSIYNILYTAEQITPLQNKWFYPDRNEKTTPQWVWYLLGGVGLLAVILIGYIISYRVQGQRITRKNNIRNRRLALVLETSQVHIWTYDVTARQFTWRNENGQAAYTYSTEEFSHRYAPEEFNMLRDVIKRLINTPRPEDGKEEEEVRLNIKAVDTESGSQEIRDFNIAISVLNRDKDGKATVIIGTKKDITDDIRQERLMEERETRYWAIFNTPMVGIMLFDREGRLQNINKKACQLYGCSSDEVLDERPSIYDMLDIDRQKPLDQLDNMAATQMVNIDSLKPEQHTVKSCKRRGKLLCEFHLLTVNDDNGARMGTFAVCSDVTYVAHSMELKRISIQNLKQAHEEMQKYTDAVNELLANADMRMVSYLPQSHILNIYDRIGHKQLELTQTRCMTLIDPRMQNKAMRLLSDMDDEAHHPFNFDIKTRLRARGSRHIMHLDFNLEPQYDSQGQLKEYFGICRDVSELKATEVLLAAEKQKTQEIEDTKTGFIRNMMQEILTPLNKVLDCANKLRAEHPGEQETTECAAILNNAERLTHIIDSILTLSRIEAHMVEISQQPTDFAELFNSFCEQGWGTHKQPGVRYIAENPFEQLIIEVDAKHLGNVIERMVKNAAQHTAKGAVRARYEYMGRRLWISIEDTGTGMTGEELERLQRQMSGKEQISNGLGIITCNELVNQMGGTLELSSEKGLGTYVMITLPCKATVIKRKNIV